VRSLLHFLRLIRIVNCLLAGAGVIIGAHVTWVVPQWTPALLTALAAFLICAAGNVLNDLVDIPIDRINRPDRVLVRGLFSRQAVLLAVVILNLGAVGVALLVNSLVALTVSGSGILLLLYNLRFKRMLLTGNLAVALLAGLTFLVGGMAIDSKLAFTLPGPLVPAVFAFVLHMVREIVKDVYDLEGDRAAGLRTLPLVHGVSTALAVAGGLSLLLVVLLLVPVA